MPKNNKRTRIDRIKNGLVRRYIRTKTSFRSHAALTITRLRWLVQHRGRKHSLPHPIVISLTSHRPRFATLLPSLQCLLTQTVQPDYVVLWVDTKDVPYLPIEITELQQRGLIIRATDNDIGPYKKIIPALQCYPDCFIVTVDDDVFYCATLLEELLHAWDGNSRTIVCHRAHQITFIDEKKPNAYKTWGYETPGPQRSVSIFPTGVGGVLYPPNSLDPRVVEEETFMYLCPRADDIWLFWMGRLNKCTYVKTTRNEEPINWPQSQAINLHSENVAGCGNDIKISAMLTHFGWPDRNSLSEES